MNKEKFISLLNNIIEENKTQKLDEIFQENFQFSYLKRLNSLNGLLNLNSFLKKPCHLVIIGNKLLMFIWILEIGKRI